MRLQRRWTSFRREFERDKFHRRVMAWNDRNIATESLENVSRRNPESAGAKRPLEVVRAPSPKPFASAARATSRARVLLADDLDLSRKLITDMLALDGHDVDCVGDGAAAVQAVEAERYDLVLMDIVMPKMDGLTATRAIRALRRPICDVPIVALTANGFREQLNACLEAGMDAAVAKPMTLESLSDVVAQWKRGRHAA